MFSSVFFVGIGGLEGALVVVALPLRLLILAASVVGGLPSDHLHLLFVLLHLPLSLTDLLVILLHLHVVSSLEGLLSWLLFIQIHLAETGDKGTH